MQAVGARGAAPVSRTGPAATVDRAVDRFREGRITEALSDLAGLTAIDLEDLEPWHRVLRSATLLECHLARGDLRQAQLVGAELAEDGPAAAGELAAALAEQALGELACACGRADAARQHFVAAGVLADGLPEDPDLLPWRLGLAIVLAGEGGAAEATELARTQLEIAGADGSPYAHALALRTVATVDTAGQRLPLLRLAKAALSGLRADRLAAQVDTDLAGLLMLSPDPGDQAEALDLLRAAEEYAARERLAPAQARVQRLLDRLGAPPRRAHGDAGTLLTPAERRVVQLAVDGLTNRQIAEELVVTVKAVEWHLSHVYRKLGISSRQRLSGALGTRV